MLKNFVALCRCCVVCGLVVSVSPGSNKQPTVDTPKLPVDTNNTTAEVSSDDFGVGEAPGKISDSSTTLTQTDDKRSASASASTTESTTATTPITKTTTIATTAVQPAAAPPAISPTEAQLARWKQTYFEPLQLVGRHASKEISFVSQSATTKGGEWLALGGEKLTLWRVLADKPEAVLWDLKSSEKSESIKSLAIDPSGTWLAAGDAAGTLRLWSLADHKEIKTKKIQNNDIIQIAISDDGREIATATHGKEVCVWDATSLEQKKKFKVNTNGLSRLIYASPGKLTVAGQSLAIWDTATGTLHKSLAEKGYAASLARSLDLSQFAFAEDDRLHILRSSDLEEVAVMKGKFARNEILKFTQDGKFLWTANGDSIRCWDRAAGRIVQVIDAIDPEVVDMDWLDKQKILRVVTENGTISYWSTPSDGEAAGQKIVHAPVEIRDTGDIPATAAELQSVVDLRLFPQPPDSDAVGGEFTMAQFESSNPIDDSRAFYRYVFAERGWKELPGNQHTPNYLNFIKNGYRVFVSLSEAAGSRSSIYLSSMGNVDVTKLPKLDLAGFKTTYEDHSSVNYEVESDLLTIETELLKKLAAAGWKPFVRLNSSNSEDSDSRSMEFLRNTMTVRVNVQRKPDEARKYHIQYSTFTAPGHLPVPDDCDFIECDVTRPSALVAKTSLSLKDCHAFYDQEMAKLGWLVAGVNQSKDDDLRWLTYFRNQNELRIRLSQAKEGGTWIIVGEYAEQNSWQLAKKKEPEEDARVAAKAGIEAADVPVFKQTEATSVKYDDSQKLIEIKLPKNSHIEIVDFYAAKFGELGWKEEPNGFREEDYAFVTFTKDEASVEVRVNSSSLGTTIGISDDGLLWNKATSETKALISYAGWLRKNKHPATLRLLDEYRRAME